MGHICWEEYNLGRGWRRGGEEVTTLAMGVSKQPWLKGNRGTSEGEREKPGGAGKACLGFWRVSERKVEKGEVRFRKAGWLGSVATKGGSVRLM